MPELSMEAAPCAQASASSRLSSSCLRSPKASKAPDLIRLSMPLRLQVLLSMREQKSASDLKRPARSRSSRILTTAFSPSPLMAYRPK